MAFNPAIPTPKKVELNKEIKGRHYWIDADVEETCNRALARSLRSGGIDFAADYRHGIRLQKQQQQQK